MNTKELEQNVKKYILSTYGRYLSPEKVGFLTSKDYSNYSNISEISVNILSDLLDTMTHKDIKINEEESVSIPYGESLKNALIQFLMNKINERFHLNISTGPILAQNLDTLKAVDQKYFEIVEENAFTKNALEIEQIEELSQIVKQYGEEDINKYLNKINGLKVNNSKEPNNKEVDINEFLKQNQTNEDKNYQTVDIGAFFNNNVLQAPANETAKIEPEKTLLERFRNGENLSLEELKELKEQALNQEQNIPSKTNAGVALRTFALYIIGLTLLIVTLFLAIIKM